MIQTVKQFRLLITGSNECAKTDDFISLDISVDYVFLPSGDNQYPEGVKVVFC